MSINITPFYQHKEGINFKKLGNDMDVFDLLNLKNESWFGTVNTACLNIQDQLKWFEKIQDDSSCKYFIAKEGDQSIGLYGFTDFNPINRSCSFTHSLFKEHRGKGLGKKTLYAGIDMTFEVFNMRRIETWILENNQAEIAVVAAVDFVEEGTKRSAVYKCGEYLDCKLFGLLRDEWENSSRVKSYGEFCNTSYKPKTR